MPTRWTMYTPDASVVARDFDPGDPEYTACHDLIAQLDQQAIPVIVPRLLLAGIAGLARRLTRDPIRARLVVDAWRTFTHVQIVSLDDALLDTAAEIAADYRCAAPMQYASRWLASTTVRLSRSTASSASAPQLLSPPAHRLRCSLNYSRHRALRDLALVGWPRRG